MLSSFLWLHLNLPMVLVENVKDKPKAMMAEQEARGMIWEWHMLSLKTGTEDGSLKLNWEVMLFAGVLETVKSMVKATY